MAHEVVLKGPASSFIAALQNQCFSLKTEMKSGLLFPIGTETSELLPYFTNRFNSQVEFGHFITKGECHVTNSTLKHALLFSQQSVTILFNGEWTMEQLKQIAEEACQSLGISSVICKDALEHYVLISIREQWTALHFT